MRAADIQHCDTRQRREVFFGLLIGYAGYYLVRRNFALTMPYLSDELGYNKVELGLALSVISIAYGAVRVFSGFLVDKLNPKTTLLWGLSLSSLIMLAFGFIPLSTSSITIIMVLLAINGVVQTLGWPSCGKIIVNWWDKESRGRLTSWWNTSHNIGAGMIAPLFLLGMFLFDDWRSGFYMPAICAVIIVLAVYFLVKPAPPNQLDEEGTGDEHDKKPNLKDLLAIVFSNRVLWLIALSNGFVYAIRYGVLDWAPTYLSEAHRAALSTSVWGYAFYEWAAIPGTILCGYVSDLYFRSNRLKTCLIFLFCTFIFICVYGFSDSILVAQIGLIGTGFFIYGPQMLLSLAALECVNKKAAASASGLTGLTGYLFGAVTANAVFGFVIEKFGWFEYFYLLIASCTLAFILLLIAMFIRVPKSGLDQKRESLNVTEEGLTS